MNNIAPEQIAQNFKAMGDSVWRINAVIANTTMQTAPVAEKKAIAQAQADPGAFNMAAIPWPAIYTRS